MEADLSILRPLIARQILIFSSDRLVFEMSLPRTLSRFVKKFSFYGTLSFITAFTTPESISHVHDNINSNNVSRFIKRG